MINYIRASHTDEFFCVSWHSWTVNSIAPFTSTSAAEIFIHSQKRWRSWVSVYQHNHTYQLSRLCTTSVKYLNLTCHLSDPGCGHNGPGDHHRRRNVPVHHRWSSHLALVLPPFVSCSPLLTAQSVKWLSCYSWRPCTARKFRFSAETLIRPDG